MTLRKKNTIQTLLFDLDGTLVDTETTAAKTLARILAGWNIFMDASDEAHLSGRTWASTLQYLFSRYPIPISKEQAHGLILQEYRIAIRDNLIMIPGAADAIRAFSEDFILGLVSGSSRKDILWAIQTLGIEDKFQVILGAEDYPRSKPEPDGYLKAMELLAAQPQECLIFEDSQAGIASAHKAGGWIVAITQTHGSPQDLSLAHHQLKDFQGVSSEWIKNLCF